MIFLQLKSYLGGVYMRKTVIFLLAIVCGVLSGCKNANPSKILFNDVGKDAVYEVADDKYRTFYEVFVYSFEDSNGDRIGDLKGLTEKLDYINDGDPSTDSDLGFNGIWLMPIMKSPSYHKYDAIDYMSVDPEYGSIDDFDVLMDECGKRNINVIIDLMLNHTSNLHPWFQEAANYISKCVKEGKTPDASECKYFNYYNFSNKAANGYNQVGTTGWYYESRFGAHMPDLNYDCEDVWKEIEAVADFWLSHGVSGFRLDAVKYLYSEDETKTLSALSRFNDYVKRKNPDAYIVGECWDSQTVIDKYYTTGIDSLFNFSFSGSSGNIAAYANTRKKLTGALTYAKDCMDYQNNLLSISKDAIDAPFFTNHDMGRAAGYFSGEYAMMETKMAGALNLLMNGAAFVYYGEELGMKGSGSDPNQRAPMYWTEDKNAEGMCKGPEEMTNVKMKYEAFDKQKEDSLSIYNFYKEVIKLRNRFPEIARGEISVCDNSTEEVCLMKKTYEGKEILIAINLTAEEQSVLIKDETVNEKQIDAKTVAGFVSASDVTERTCGEMFADDTLAVPAFSVVIFQ